MIYKVTVSGFGGQGVLSLGQFLAYSAVEDDKHTTWLPAYGPEMRGGAASCGVIVSDAPVADPIVAAPDCLIALNAPALGKFAPRVKRGGLIIVNASSVSEKVTRADVTALYVPAEKLAEEAGNKKAFGTALLAVLIKHSKILKPESVEKGIAHMLSEKPHLIEVNKKTFQTTYTL